MKISVIGCGRWGSYIAYYLHSIGNSVTLYGRESSATMQRLLKTRDTGLFVLPEEICLSVSLAKTMQADVLVISVNSQGLRALMQEMQTQGLAGKTLILCMKGVEIGSGKRLSEVAAEYAAPDTQIAVWIGPGHVQDFMRGIPNCMVIDSNDSRLSHQIAEQFSGDLIRFYDGVDLIGNEIGAAAKNVIGIAAGFLDGMGLSSLKGALMSRGTLEISRLIEALGGSPLSAYGLCHLGDYEATVFSPHSHNRGFGEAFVKKEPFDGLAEGFYTVKALVELGARYGVELPICEQVYSVLYEGADIRSAIEQLFTRSRKKEF